MNKIFSIEIESEEYQLKVDDTTDVNSWILALGPVIDKYCEAQYYTAYSFDSDICDDARKEVSEAYAETVKDYLRNKSSDEPVVWKEMWRDKMQDIFPPNEIIWEWDSFIEEVKESIMMELDELDDELPFDEDEFDNAVAYEIEGRLIKEDDSDIFDALDAVEIPLIYIPGRDQSSSIDNYDVYEDGKLTDGDLSFMRMTGVKVSDYMKTKDLELNAQTVRQWSQAVRETESYPSYTNSKGDQLSIKCSAKELLEIVENSGMDGVLPCWVGRVSIGDLRDNDPALPFAVSGGAYGLVNFTSGSGYLSFMQNGDSLVIEEGGQLEEEGYYSVDSIFGFTESSLVAKLISNDDIFKVDNDKIKTKKRDVQLNLIP